MPFGIWLFERKSGRMNASFQLIAGAKRKLKHGEPPSKEAQEFVVRLAEQKPRPINKFIQEAFQTKYKRSISVRTIARYCEEAGLPTSSRSSNPKSKELPPEVKPQPVSQQLIDQMKKLVKKIGRLTAVPIPEKRFHPDRDEWNAADAAMRQGNNKPYLSLLGTLTTPWWWCPRRSTRIRGHLDHEEAALLDRFLELPPCQSLRGLIEEWESTAETYRKLKELNAEAGDIKQAYLWAIEAKDKLDAELAKAVVALY